MRQWLDRNRIERDEVTKQKLRDEIKMWQRKAIRLETFLVRMPDKCFPDGTTENMIIKDLVSKETVEIFEFMQKEQKEIDLRYLSDLEKLDRNALERKPIIRPLE